MKKKIAETNHKCAILCHYFAFSGKTIGNVHETLPWWNTVLCLLKVKPLAVIWKTHTHCPVSFLPPAWAPSPGKEAALLSRIPVPSPVINSTPTTLKLMTELLHILYNCTDAWASIRTEGLWISPSQLLAALWRISLRVLVPYDS